jgi:hypothetical protein
LSWKSEKGKIFFSVNNLKALYKDFKEIKVSSDIERIQSFFDKLTIVFPKNEKFRDTLLNQTYYDLLRIYANELDKENTLLISEGFSFADEHIFSITERALKNPTLKLIIFCYKKDELEYIKRKFHIPNVDFVYSSDKNIDFSLFNDLTKEILHPLKENINSPSKDKSDER